MSGLTGDRNIDALILMRLDDRELNIVCASNKYLKSMSEGLDP